MIIFNYVKWCVILLTCIFLWYIWPAIVALIAWSVRWPAVQGGIVGFLCGLIVPISIGWNMAVRSVRDEGLDREHQAYERRRKTWRK